MRWPSLTNMHLETTCTEYFLAQLFKGGMLTDLNYMIFQYWVVSGL